MAQLAISAAGAAVGFAVGGVTGAQYGWLAGSLVGATLFPPDGPGSPKVGDLKAPAVQYGTRLLRLYGSNRVSGVLAWYSEKRVLAGSSGGKGEPEAATADTAEIDVLYILSIDSEVIAITRVWINGELKWTGHADSDSDSVSNSGATESWNAIHFLDGNPAQLPHPVIEASEGVGNAPAYRHRQCVLIDSLQLGNSGYLPLLEFECITRGDVVPAKTRLQSYFDSNDSTDISWYANGAGTLTGAELFNNMLSIDHDDASPAMLVYNNANIAHDAGEPITIEMIVRWWSNPAVHYMRSMTYVSNTGFEGSTTYAFGFSTAAGLIVFDDGNVGTRYTGDALPPIETHLALVLDENGYRFYVGGVLKYTLAGDVTPELSAPLGEMRLGDPAGYVSITRTKYDIHEFAIRFESQYTDDFEPPTRIKPPDFPTYAPQPHDLQEIVEAEWERVGDLADIDASELAGIPVRGFQTGGSVRGAYEALASIFHFGAVCSDKLYFRLQGGSSVATIPFADLAAGEDKAADEPFVPERANDEEVPERIALTYINQLDDYANGTETGNRGSASRIVLAQQTNVVMYPGEAKACAETFAAQAGIAAITGQIALTDEYAELEPTDPITVPDEDGTLYRMRIVRETLGGGVRTLDLVLDDASVLNAPGVTSEDYTPSLSVLAPATAQMILLDIPLLQDVDDSPGFYVAAKGDRSAALFTSIDNVTFENELPVPVTSIFGYCTTALGDWTGINVFDETNTVTVHVGTGTLSSSTDTALLSDPSVNACAIGVHGRWELLQFRTATLVSAGVYTLSGLLRGVRGTEWAKAGHLYSDGFVLLTNSLRRVTQQASAIGALRYYLLVWARSVPVGSQPFTNEAVSLKPLAPVDVETEVSAGDVVLTWNRRTRLSSAFLSSSGTPLGELTEAYEIDVVLVSSGAVLRTLTATTQTVTYTAAQQSADLLTTGTDIRFDVYQMSAVVGRGYAGTISIDSP